MASPIPEDAPITIAPRVGERVEGVGVMKEALTHYEANFSNP
jgi:hypothetical protein